MKKNSLAKFIFKIILSDMILNWILGILFAFFPGSVKDWLFYERLTWLPFWFWFLAGIGFLAFAAWQLKIVLKGKINRRELIFASAMALLPAALLTFSLLFLSLPLFLSARILLWLGDIYMLFLGIGYFILADRFDLLKSRWLRGG